MTIRREDLVAAAAAGLLQYRQIDPLLVFLLQRDIRAKRQALAEQVRPRKYQGVYKVLSIVVALLAVITAALFGMLLATRAMPSTENGAFVFFAILYLGVAIGVAAWFRRRGYGARIRVAFAVVMASVPLAVVALQQVAS